MAWLSHDAAGSGRRWKLRKAFAYWETDRASAGSFAGVDVRSENRARATR
jgi:hypothetical protein